MTRQVSGRDDPRFREIDSFDSYLGTDIARTHGFTRSEEAAAIDQQLLDEQHEQLLLNGYVIIENMVSQSTLDALRQDTRPLLDKVGRNSFEGERTQRIYAVPEKIRSADPFIEHPLILAHLDRLFRPNYLLSQVQVISVMTDSPPNPYMWTMEFTPGQGHARL